MGAGAEPDAGRLFLAVPLAETARERLAAALREPLPGKPVRPESWHLTLRFLGDTSRPARDALVAGLRARDLGPAFEVRFGGYGAFPRPARASVLWLGVEEGVEPLRRLAAIAEEAARRAGFPPENRPFAAHLTLSRLRSPDDVRPLLERLPPFREEMRVPEVVLYRSHLGGGPPRYEAVERFRLV